MSVDSVSNSNNNTALYTASGAVLGAGVGVAAGYLTKPFLKDGVPTDSFQKQLGDNLIGTLSEDQKKLIKQCSQFVEKLPNVKNTEELTNLTMEYVNQATADCKTVKDFVNSLEVGNNLASFLGLSGDSQIVEDIAKAKNIEEVKKVISDNISGDINAKGFEASKAEMENVFKAFRDAGIPLTPKELGKATWDLAYDKTDKKLVKGEVTDEAFAIIKKTMHKVQGKYAAIYGAIGAATLGVVGYLCGAFGGNKEQPKETSQKIETQA